MAPLGSPTGSTNIGAFQNTARRSKLEVLLFTSSPESSIRLHCSKFFTHQFYLKVTLTKSMKNTKQNKKFKCCTLRKTRPEVSFHMSQMLCSWSYRSRASSDWSSWHSWNEQSLRLTILTQTSRITYKIVVLQYTLYNFSTLPRTGPTRDNHQY